MDLSLLPVGNAQHALIFEHFPTRHQAVIWRNINLVPSERIARALGTTRNVVISIAEEMGLTVDERNTALWLERGFQTIIRRNWELLPYEQILQLLEWTPEKLAFILKEDDFFWVKLGYCKPQCQPVLFRELSDAEKNRTSEIRALMLEHFGNEPPATAQPFDFLKGYGHAEKITGNIKRPFGLRMIYSYSALYGDPLLDPEIGSYPEAMLADYAAAGVNAIWMQATLYTLYPWLGEELPQSARWQERLKNLNTLVQRGKRHGVDIILYLNEPRAMPADFFREHPDWRGAKLSGSDDWALCTSKQEIRDRLEEGVYQLFRNVPGLGGMFTITMSENLTHCKSRNSLDLPCPRCANRSAAELTAELNRILESGMRRASPEAQYVAYSWAWSPKWDKEVIQNLPKRTSIMAVSETHLETDCEEIKGNILDYSLSKVGPGKVARRQWDMARSYGYEVVAKVQFNCSWELASVPYIPVPDLVERHLKNLEEAGVSGLMLSWTHGGFPGGNLGLLSASREELAEQKFGSAAPVVLSAWSTFSSAFERFPFNGTSGIYTYPGNFGPMSLLWRQPTYRSATMIGFPYDDLFAWRCAGTYPEPLFEEIFQKICNEWQSGLDQLNAIQITRLNQREQENLQELKRVALACLCSFKSTLNQVRFIRRRGLGVSLDDILADELIQAKTLRQLMREDSRLGYEASNHYFYTENDLAEKMLNCTSLIGEPEHRNRF